MVTIIRTAAVALAVSSFVWLAGCGSAEAASMDPNVDLICNNEGFVQFDPPLNTEEPRSTKLRVTSDFTDCTSPSRLDKHPGSGRIEYEIEVPVDCSVTFMRGEGNVKWDNGESSYIAFGRLAGKVQTGLFAGHRIHFPELGVEADGFCPSENGVSKFKVNGRIAFIPPVV